MAYQDIEESRLYQRAEKLADRVWDLVVPWEWFAKDTVGKQLISTETSGQRNHHRIPLTN